MTKVPYTHSHWAYIETDTSHWGRPPNSRIILAHDCRHNFEQLGDITTVAIALENYYKHATAYKKQLYYRTKDGPRVNVYECRVCRKKFESNFSYLYFLENMDKDHFNLFISTSVIYTRPYKSHDDISFPVTITLLCRVICCI